MLNVIDEYSRQCLAIRVRRRFTAVHVVEVLSELMILEGHLSTFRLIRALIPPRS
jgi:putative transposase